MEYFKNYDSVREYIDMTEGYDGRFLIEILHDYLDYGKSVLELGIGPGRDFEILEKNYKVTGSDYSQLFLDIYEKKNPKADLIYLDANSLDTDRCWDSIYSNKVMHHLKREELVDSLYEQTKLLNFRGIVMHSFWKGQGDEVIKGLHFSNYEVDELRKVFERYYDILAIEEYSEIDENDSIYVIARKR